MKVRMFTFLHKLHYGALNERHMPQRSGARVVAETLHTRRGKLNGVKPRRFQRAFWQLPDRQREALVLEVAGGLSRDEVSAVCGCSTAAVTALVALARRQLLSSLVDCEEFDRRGAACWPSAAGQVDDEMPDDVLLSGVGVPGYEPRA
jgi:DNA-directed RNA polymerase specialized sigma24 family protein